MFHLGDIISPSVDIDINTLVIEESALYDNSNATADCSDPEALKGQDLAMDRGFDLENIVHGPPVFIRKKVYYQGHAATTYSVEQATNIIEHLGRKFDSEDTLPFAMQLIENGQLIAVAQDNGEYACGKVLATSLQRMQGFNVLVCVTCHVGGSFVTDIFQMQKQRFVREAADKALDLLYLRLVGTPSSVNREMANEFDSDIAIDPPQQHQPFPDRPQSKPSKSSRPVSHKQQQR